MSPDFPATKITFRDLDIFPVIVDYDMEAGKCRGMSARIDLFSYGALTAEIDKLKGEGLRFAVEEGVIIRKKGLIFSSGFFLFDFNYYMQNIEKFAEKINSLNMPLVYIENSDRFDLTPLIGAGVKCRIELLEF
ncbi:hypothetical protein [Seleniivibrio sp.]|uniref:hypothetical protein n=1 Tax=Seleniivibrio sp. TaxID=2898801 RepID=UPI0025F3F044|nr:hypothetical protein [Seleniivibrio sp.]MCD8554191.1 hypothetical protein [Seleniivibrio sp.]